METKRELSTRTMVLGAILTALVVILQMMGAFIKFGTFSISLVLIPIVIGAATCGIKVSTWLGLVFGAVVLLSGDAAPFMAVNVPGTIITVLLKGIGCGFVAGIVYKFISKYSETLAIVLAAILCPITNTGIFIIGCFVFFLETVTGWAQGAGFGSDIGAYIIFGLVTANFLFELGTNIILTPIVTRLLKIKNYE